MRVLFVCLGNICRSPTAEAILRARAPHLHVDSAGTGDWHLGDPPYGPAIEAGRTRGYDLTPLRARQVSAADFDDFDLILAMDRRNLGDIERLRPAGSETPVKLCLDFSDMRTGQDVPDPYFTNDFEEALDLIESAVDGILRDIERA